MRVYVGEADLLATRIGQHYCGPGAKDFWTRAVALVSTNDNLNKAHVRHIEARLVGLALAAKRCKVENSNLPSEPKLSEYDLAEAESFLENMLLIYPLVGIRRYAVDRPRGAGPLLQAPPAGRHGRAHAGGPATDGAAGHIGR